MMFRCAILLSVLAFSLTLRESAAAASLRNVGDDEDARRLKIDSNGVKTLGNGKRILVRDLKPSTGFNDICGEKLMPDFPIQMQFTYMRNTAGGEPFPLTPSLCKQKPDGVLATFANRQFYQIKGWPLPDSRLENLPYNEVPITVFLDGSRQFVSDHVDGVPQPGASHSYPNHPETVSTFLQVSGSMSLTCETDGTAEVVIHGNDYLEGEILTVWVLWSNTSPLPPLLPMALGGTPNVVVVDENGKFTFKRILNFCPLDVQNGGKSAVVSFAIAKHLDGGCTYGNVPQNVLAEYSFRKGDETFVSKGNGPGIMTVDKGMIEVNVASV